MRTALQITKKSLSISCRFFAALGVAFFILMLSSLTSYPWKIYRWLSCPSATASAEPNYLVLLGGGGIPSESGLMRCYQAAHVASLYTNSKIIIARPAEEGVEIDAAARMAEELTLHKVDSKRFLFEDQGRNTHEQALNVSKIISITNSLLIITSPEHTKRTLLSFKKLGFQNIYSSPAYDVAVQADLTYDVPHVGNNLTLRYRLWDNWMILIKCAREGSALVYYKLVGWI